MPQALDGGDRRLLIGAGVLLVVLLLASTIIAPPQMTGASTFPSSYSPDWNGAKAAFLVLQDAGYRVERWERSPTEIPGEANTEVLILSEPSQPPSSEERFAIREFLQQGGRVLATGSAAAQFLPSAAGFDEGEPSGDKKHFGALIHSSLSRDAPEITMVPPESWQPKFRSQQIVYGNEDTAAVVTYPFGKGQVIWWAAATPLTNANIRDAGNLALLLNSVGPLRTAYRGNSENTNTDSNSATDSLNEPVRILWDEYFHGVSGSLWTYFARTPLPWAAAQFCLVFLAILATYSRRQEPIRAPVSAPRLSPLEFVEALGDLYQSAHAGSAAIRIAAQRLRFLLTRQLGLPTNVPIAELARSAGRQLAWDEAPLLRALTQAEQFLNDPDRQVQSRKNKSGGEALQLVQQLFDYGARMETGRTPAAATGGTRQERLAG